MSVNPRTLALSYISYLVSNLNKKNYKSSVLELADLVEKYGFEADRHLFRCLLSHVDLSTDGKQSGGKDFHQVQLLIQEAGTLITKPYCASVVCYGLENPELKALRASGLLFQQLSRVLRLTRVQEAVFGIGLLKSSDSELRTEASQFLKNKLPDLLRSYTDIDVSSGQEGGLNDVAIEVLHLLLSYLQQSPPEQAGGQTDQLHAFVTALRRDFPRDRVPVVLSPLLYSGDQDIAQDKLLPESAVTGPARMAQLELSDILQEIGHHVTSSHDLLRDLVRQVDTEGLTPLCVAKVVGLIVSTHTGMSDQVPLQSLTGPSSPLWEKDKPQEQPALASTWNLDIVVDVVKELAPHLNWQEVMASLDHPGFMVKDAEGLRVVMKMYKRATNDLFPVQILYRVWSNVEGQLSWIKFGVTGMAEFSFSDYIWHAVKVDALKAPPDQENRQTMTWLSLELIETLMCLAEAGQYDPVLSLFSYPIKHCPDVLMLAILQVKPRWNTLQSELFNHLLPIFLASHPSNPNTLGVLQFAWTSPLTASTVRPQMLQGMADWYMKGEVFDQVRLIRVLEIAHELKALSLLLNGTQFQFVIDLAVLASRREFLKLDKWMSDRVREHQETFVAACAVYLKQRTSHADKGIHLPPEVITTMLAILQVCQVPPSSEATEILHQLVEEFGPIVPRIRPSQLLLSHSQPQPAKGFDPGLAPGARVQPVAAVNPVAPTAVPPSMGLPGFGSGQQQLPIGGLPPSLKPAVFPQSALPSIPSNAVQTGLPGIDQQLLGPSIPSGDVFTSGLPAVLKQHSQSQAVQPPRSALPPSSAASSVRQDVIPGNDQVFSKEIEEEANSYFQRIYSRVISLDGVLEKLKMFKNSLIQKEKDVYLCMLKSLFEEYRFFPHYPEKELLLTGSLFGGLIENSLVTYISLGTALRYVLEALKKPPGTNMHMFGVAAMDKFKGRLKEYPQYCQHVSAISHFKEFPSLLIQFVDYGQHGKDPPPRPSQLPATMAAGPTVPGLTRPTVATTVAVQVQPPKPTAKPMGLSPNGATTASPQTVTVTGKAQGPSIANTTNIDTLLLAVDSVPTFSIPPDDVQENVGFIFNNMTLQNLTQKAEEVKVLIEDKHWKWLAHYMVLKRVSIEPNYHATYVAFVDLHRDGDFGSCTLTETYRNIKVLLHASKGDTGFSDRSLLKNLGHWLGLLTLARSIPILQKDIAMKHLLLEAYSKGAQEMLYVVPFVTKVVEACGNKSSVFKPPNPWTMAVLGVLVEMHALPNVKLNLKFEVEVLCKTLSVELKDVKPKGLLSNAEKLRRFTQLSPPVEGPTAPVVHQPTFYYMDINVTSLAGLKDHLQINGDLALFQAHPLLKQYVKPSVERAVQELINPVVERSIKIAVTTTEHILKKDFALDPEEGRMRMAAHHMVRHLTAGMAMITCREPLYMSINNNLKQTFSRLLMATPNDMQKQMIEKSADTVALDNTELACAFVQKTAMEKAVPEMDKRLAEEFELRKMARTEGRRYCNHLILTYQAERMPEPLRHKVGGVTTQQARVYEEFANCVPGFLPPKQPPTKITQGYPADEVVHILEKCAQELQQHLSATAAPRSNSHMIAMHVLYDTLQQVLLMRGDAASALLLLQKAMEGLLEGMAQQLSDKDLATRFRDCHLLVLKGLQDPRAYGPVWASKHSTRILLESREEIKFNVEAVVLLIRAQLVTMREFDIHMAQAMENGLNFAAVTFCMRLARLYFIEEKQDCPISQGDLYHVLDTLARLAANARHPPEGLTSLLEVVRIGREQMEMGYAGDIRLLSTTGVGPTPADFDDPPGLHEKVEYLLTEWVRLYHQPISSRDSEKLYAAYLGKLHQHGMLKSDDLISRFFRISTEMCVELCYRNLNLSEHRMNNPALARAKCYHTMDAYVKLIVVLVKHSGDPTNTVTKINLLNKVLSTVVHVLAQDHEVRRTEFQQLPYHRLLVMLLQELNVPDPIFDSINFQVLQSFSNTFHNLRPARAPGFAFAWLELTSHRTMIGKLLGSSPQQKGWGLYQQLLLDLFRFLAPFLRNAELAKSTQLLYRGTLRLLLVLLHDFPEFLCDYHFSFCDVIPPNCIQMRNLILSAFPRNMRLPDPFTPNLKVDLLTDITHAPRILTNISAAIQPGTFKKDLDSYIKTRAPVTFLSELRTHLQTSIEPGTRYNVSLMNALVLYVGMQAITYIHSRSGTPSSSTITHSSHMDIFQNLAVDLDTEGRYLFLNAVANQLRYPNSHTHYFSCVLLYLFAEANSEAIQEQITRVLLERLIVNRPHPWGLLITFIELIRNHTYKFWNHQFVHCAPEIEKLFESVARSCMQQKQAGQPLAREETAEA